MRPSFSGRLGRDSSKWGKRDASSAAPAPPHRPKRGASPEPNGTSAATGLTREPAGTGRRHGPLKGCRDSRWRPPPSVPRQRAALEGAPSKYARRSHERAAMPQRNPVTPRRRGRQARTRQAFRNDPPLLRIGPTAATPHLDNRQLLNTVCMTIHTHSILPTPPAKSKAVRSGSLRSSYRELNGPGCHAPMIVGN